MNFSKVMHKHFKKYHNEPVNKDASQRKYSTHKYDRDESLNRTDKWPIHGFRERCIMSEDLYPESDSAVIKMIHFRKSRHKNRHRLLKKEESSKSTKNHITKCPSDLSLENKQKQLLNLHPILDSKSKIFFIATANRDHTKREKHELKTIEKILNKLRNAEEFNKKMKKKQRKREIYTQETDQMLSDQQVDKINKWVTSNGDSNTKIKRKSKHKHKSVSKEDIVKIKVREESPENLGQDARRVHKLKRKMESFNKISRDGIVPYYVTSKLHKFMERSRSYSPKIKKSQKELDIQEKSRSSMTVDLIKMKSTVGSKCFAVNKKHVDVEHKSRHHHKKEYKQESGVNNAPLPLVHDKQIYEQLQLYVTKRELKHLKKMKSCTIQAIEKVPRSDLKKEDSEIKKHETDLKKYFVTIQKLIDEKLENILPNYRNHKNHIDREHEHEDRHTIPELIDKKFGNKKLEQQRQKKKEMYEDKYQNRNKNKLFIEDMFQVPMTDWKSVEKHSKKEKQRKLEDILKPKKKISNYSGHDKDSCELQTEIIHKKHKRKPKPYIILCRDQHISALERDIMLKKDISAASSNAKLYTVDHHAQKEMRVKTPVKSILKIAEDNLDIPESLRIKEKEGEKSKSIHSTNFKVKQKNHKRRWNLECKTVSIVTIPSQKTKDESEQYCIEVVKELYKRPDSPSKANEEFIEKKKKTTPFQKYYTYSSDRNLLKDKSTTDAVNKTSDSNKLFCDSSETASNDGQETLDNENEEPSRRNEDPDIDEEDNSNKSEVLKEIQHEVINSSASSTSLTSERMKSKREKDGWQRPKTNGNDSRLNNIAEEPSNGTYSAEGLDLGRNRDKSNTNIERHKKSQCLSTGKSISDASLKVFENPDYTDVSYSTYNDVYRMRQKQKVTTNQSTSTLNSRLNDFEIPQKDQNTTSNFNFTDFSGISRNSSSDDKSERTNTTKQTNMIQHEKKEFDTSLGHDPLKHYNEEFESKVETKDKIKEFKESNTKSAGKERKFKSKIPSRLGLMRTSKSDINLLKHNSTSVERKKGSPRHSSMENWSKSISKENKQVVASNINQIQNLKNKASPKGGVCDRKLLPEEKPSTVSANKRKSSIERSNLQNVKNIDKPRYYSGAESSTFRLHEKQYSTTSNFSKSPEHTSFNNDHGVEEHTHYKENKFELKGSKSDINIRQRSPRQNESKINSFVAIEKPNSCNDKMSKTLTSDNTSCNIDKAHCGNSGRLFLTKDFKGTEISAYEKRKFYGENIRKKLKKRIPQTLNNYYDVNFFGIPNRSIELPEALKFTKFNQNFKRKSTSLQFLDNSLTINKANLNSIDLYKGKKSKGTNTSVYPDSHLNKFKELPFIFGTASSIFQKTIGSEINFFYPGETHNIQNSIILNKIKSNQLPLKQLINRHNDIANRKVLQFTDAEFKRQQMINFRNRFFTSSDSDSCFNELLEFETKSNYSPRVPNKFAACGICSCSHFQNNFRHVNIYETASNCCQTQIYPNQIRNKDVIDSSTNSDEPPRKRKNPYRDFQPSKRNKFTFIKAHTFDNGWTQKAQRPEEINFDKEVRDTTLLCCNQQSPNISRKKIKNISDNSKGARNSDKSLLSNSYPSVTAYLKEKQGSNNKVLTEKLSCPQLIDINKKSKYTQSNIPEYSSTERKLKIENCPKIKSAETQTDFEVSQINTNTEKKFGVSQIIKPKTTTKSTDTSSQLCSEESGYASTKSKKCSSVTSFFKRKSIISLFKPSVSNDKFKKVIDETRDAFSNCPEYEQETVTETKDISSVDSLSNYERNKLIYYNKMTRECKLYAHKVRTESNREVKQPYEEIPLEILLGKTSSTQMDKCARKSKITANNANECERRTIATQASQRKNNIITIKSPIGLDEDKSSWKGDLEIDDIDRQLLEDCLSKKCQKFSSSTEFLLTNIDDNSTVKNKSRYGNFISTTETLLTENRKGLHNADNMSTSTKNLGNMGTWDRLRGRRTDDKRKLKQIQEDKNALININKNVLIDTEILRSDLYKVHQGTSLITKNNTGSVVMNISPRRTEEPHVTKEENVIRLDEFLINSVIGAGKNCSSMETNIHKNFFEKLLAAYEKEIQVSDKLCQNDEFFENELVPIIDKDKYTELDDIKKIKKKRFIRNPFKRKNKEDCISVFEEKNNSEAVTPDFELMSAYLENATEQANKLSKQYTITNDGDENKIESDKSHHLKFLACNAKRHLSSLVQAASLNNNIYDEMKINGFLKLLEKIEEGDFDSLRREDEVNFEDEIKEQIKQAFVTKYEVAFSEAKKYNKTLSANEVQLIRTLVTKYRIVLMSHLDLLATYIGQGKIQNENQLKAAVNYLCRLKETNVNSEELEKCMFHHHGLFGKI